ncbi:hypothetical protein FQA47_022089 [Oryzias melastigma]|uniref:Uncharacterized protein n=1 Tax=Oryzias melastigma TaxID=30732 RepID=A0A834KY86_ORYME|nr:hypothetical protein FQA47_022089 [Oryzias melastigma]
MSRNSSSTNSFLTHSPLDLSISTELHCYTTKPSSIIYTCFYVVNSVVLLPLYAFILYCGLQKRKQMRSSSSASAVSHSDSFTYHILFVELIGVVGLITCIFGIHGDHVNVRSRCQMN